MDGLEIVEAARGWLGTAFHHQGRLKRSAINRGGCDCLGLLVGVANDLQLQSPKIDKTGQFLSRFDVLDYGHIPDGKRLKTALDGLLIETRTALIQPGDVLLMRFEEQPQHLAIVSDYPLGGLGIIHALASVRKVVEHRLDALWQSRIIAAYRLFEMPED